MNNCSSEFVWRVENFSKLQVGPLPSDKFTLSGYEWIMTCFLDHNLENLHLYLFLGVADPANLPTGYTNIKLVVLDQINNKFSIERETKYLFTKKKYYRGYAPLMPLSKLRDSSRAYLVNDTLVVKVEIKADPPGSLTTVSNVVPGLAIKPQGPTPLTEVVQLEGANRLRRTEVVHLSDLPETKLENANVNGFQVLASKADIVERIFEKHPDLVSNFHLKNHQFRSAFMNSILALIEKFCKSPVDFSEDDLSYSCTTLMDLENVGFQVDWINTKLEEIVRRKRQAGELVKKLEEMKQAMHNLEAEAESARASLSINDIV